MRNLETLPNLTNLTASSTRSPRPRDVAAGAKAQVETAMTDDSWTEDLLTDEDTCTEAEILEAFQGFLEGDLTLAQLEGFSAEDLYQVADMGYDLLSEGRLEDAKKIFEGLYCYNPFDAYFHTALGSIYHRMDELDSAYEHYLSAVELYDEDVQTWTNLGEVALEQSTRLIAEARNEEAEEAFVTAAEAFGRAIGLDPEAQQDAGRRAHALVHLTVGAMQRAVAI